MGTETGDATFDRGRFERQRSFALELDREKHVERQTHVVGMSRRENDAEHAWHMAALVYLLREYADEPFDLARALAMALFHDVVEIDAGDAYAYDEEAQASSHERERAAAARLFGMLPDDQEADLRCLWEEFEAGETPEARMAHLADNLQPMLLNLANEGDDWRAHGVRRSQTAMRRAQIHAASRDLGAVVEELFDDAVRRGWLGADGDGTRTSAR